MCGGTIWEHADADVVGRVLQARVRGEPPDVRALFRGVNEELAAAAAGDELELVCECADARCFAAISLDRDDFDALVATPGYHAVLPGHKAYDERAIAEGSRFAVVAPLVPAHAAAAEVEAHGRGGRGRPRQ
jgi:hypothetical protein